ncbi:MAG: UvrD-helicase domain-containing protein, partial [Pseudomonadota bacterium]|nr:UvrD-helicase domain-containing protein [Pseudomonadota bacterium]
MSSNIRFISAGAGSGKTYRLTQELNRLLGEGGVRPSGVIATTFTRLAANELRERVTQELAGSGQISSANQMGQALIGTVNAVCAELLVRFAFEAGLSPDQKVLEEADAMQLFGEAVESALGEHTGRIRRMNELAHRLQKTDRQKNPVWQKDVQEIVAQARANDMSPEQLRAWGRESADSLLAFFPPPTQRELDAELLRAVAQVIDAIDTDEDTTKATRAYVSLLDNARRLLGQSRLPWSDWVKLSKTSPAKKSKSQAEAVRLVAGDSEKHPRLQAETREFSAEVFAIAADSLQAYQDLKVRQGIMDFVDQEQRLYHLLDHPHVSGTLKEELQLLLVDEFQDTSPIQLALFVKLAALADRVIWVGDLKQAIYGFRGSDPALMQAVLEKVVADGGGTDVLPYSWRSRPARVQYA